MDILKHNNRKRLYWIGAGILIICLFLTVAYTLVKDLPGGFADQKLSHKTGLEGTMRIPLGKTPEDAVLKFRDFKTMQVIHKESVKEGMLLFIKRFNKEEGTDLQLEFVRKTWLGWKWGWGGGFSIGSITNSSLDYMVMQKINGVNNPFPLVYGEVFNPSITNINIVTEGQNADVYAAKLIDAQAEHKIWLSLLPESLTTPFEIQAFNAKGDIVVRKTINDLTDSGEITIK
ncbi:hypothetical protein H8B09_06815 [Paenibacillus sp. PR3]|uniref:Uncharacterized protein n=1 Tax=Paenibacillus terricola TaxID=2763503 RepID=A0ABR8MS46_9BACL|nr:hypothetical protein [Paenibacillus terricola]MBD3918460.1 hypothetical protein [Paenibacillus terricola]